VSRKIFNDKSLKSKRKELRNNPTDPEYRLWYFLRNSQLDKRKFRRQESIGKYIVDFYCPEEKLVVELDGAQHIEEKNLEYDKKRDDYLRSLGLYVLRFKNEEVLYGVDNVLRSIKNCFGTTPSRKRATPPH
jgi:very-short-patch-repair endonuclease